MKKQILFLLTAGTFLFASCGGEENADEQKLLAEPDTAKQVKINHQVLDEMIMTLPQPIEIANIITKSNMEFSKTMLVPSENSDSYADKYYQSMAFGAYGVDLGYINLNEKTLYTLEYLESIRNLSKDLKVDQFFDFSSLAELSKNRNNADSLVQISTRNFNKIDGFLRENDRGEQSVLILIGAWIEGMHMFGEIQKTAPSQDINTRIGEQKVVFDNVYALLDKMSAIDHFKMMKTDFADLKAAYDKVEIAYIYREPETKEIDGELVFIDKSETKISIDDATLAQVVAGIEKIRLKYLLTTKK
jgi:hypothetical protein